MVNNFGPVVPFYWDLIVVKYRISDVKHSSLIKD